MRIYIDTGIFFDYLIGRGHVESILRKAGRRTRSNKQLSEDVFECFEKMRKKHDVFTSSITLYEAEDAMLRQLANDNKGTPYRETLSLMSARAVILQVQTIISMYSIQMVDLTKDVFDKAVSEKSFQIEGVKTGDTLHFSTAILNDVDIIITGDNHFLSLDEKFINSRGIKIKCVDTDMAKGIL